MPRTRDKKGQQIAANTAKKHNSPAPGLPRFDPIDRRLHCFYEPLVLLRILEPTLGSRKHDMPFDSTDESFRSCCRQFIDKLSWLCDYRPGGRTVSSIAIEDAPQGPIYWLAANENPNEKVRAHLESILKQLENLRSSSKEASLAIRHQSIHFSREKVKYYVRQLGFAVNDARRSLDNQMSANGSVLFQQLDSLQEMNDDHDLVARAFDFRHGDFDQLLNQMIAGTADWCHWHMIRHYIGRLRSWPRSAELLVRLARKHPLLVSDFNCEVVPKTSPMRSPPPDGKSNLDSILRRTVRKSENERLEKLQNSLNCMRHFDIEEDFKQQYAEKSLTPRIHSELQILEHFYSDDRKFLNNDRYIGCSKPSCYCCDLYIRLHPGRFEPRACHGNLWTNWAFPVDIRTGSPSSVHVKKILDGMKEHVRRDLLQQIESRLPQRRKWPDSTTGMSRSILASNSIRTDPAEILHRKPAPGTNFGRSGLVPDGDDIDQSLTEAMINVHLSVTGQEHHAKSHKRDESEHAQIRDPSRVGSGLHEELVAIEKNDWQDADEGGVLLIPCEEDSTRKYHVNSNRSFS